MIHVRCHKCNKKYAVPEEAKGKRIRCRRCLQVIVVSEDVTDWLNAMSYATSQRQESDDPVAASQDSSGASATPAQPQPAAASESSTEPGTAPPDGASSSSPPDQAQPFLESPPTSSLRPDEAEVNAVAVELPPSPVPVDKTVAPPDRDSPLEIAETRPIGRLLLGNALLASLLTAMVLLVSGLWLREAIPGRGYRLALAGLTVLMALAALAGHLLVCWRILRACRDARRR